MKMHTLATHLRHTTINDIFIQFKIRNPVAQQATDSLLFFIHIHLVPGTSKLLRARQTGRSGANDGDAFSSFMSRNLRCNPVIFPTLFNDRLLNGFNRDRRPVNIQRTRFLAGCRAHTPGKLRKIIG